MRCTAATGSQSSSVTSSEVAVCMREQMWSTNTLVTLVLNANSICTASFIIINVRQICTQSKIPTNARVNLPDYLSSLSITEMHTCTTWSSIICLGRQTGLWYFSNCISHVWTEHIRFCKLSERGLHLQFYQQTQHLAMRTNYNESESAVQSKK